MHTPLRLLSRARGQFARRWVLWGALCLLVGLLLAALVFLAREYEDTLTQARHERAAADMASDLRAGVLRNVQNLVALHSVAGTPNAWTASAAELLAAQREIVHAEWRDARMRVRAARASPYWPDLPEDLDRTNPLAEVRQACVAAERQSGPAFSSSYFLPTSQGLGLELMEMCLPVSRFGRDEGFMVVTYSLTGMLQHLLPLQSRRGARIALLDPDGTRLAVVDDMPGASRVLQASQVLDLAGVTYLLRMERPAQARGLFPHVLTAAVAALALALAGVLALFARDLRRRQRAETRLAEALAFRKAMEDSLVTGLRARDMDGRITYVNPAFCAMVGLSPEVLLDSGVPAPYWPPEQVEEYRQRHAVRVAGQGSPREGFESLFMRADGTRFPVLIIEAPLINAQGQQTGWMSAILDISEQRRSEELSRTSQERLQATARLAMVGEMASLISHELNQPLAAISSYASGSLNLLGQAPPPVQDDSWRADITEALRRIAEQAERAGKVIKGVGDLVRSRQRSREAVPVATLFEAVTPLLQLQARKLNLVLVMDVAPDCPAVWCDRTMVEQVLLNLARNGMQAMASHEPCRGELRRLRLSAQPITSEPGAPGWVAFAVSDHGPGLSPAQAEHLFTPFFTTKAEGMGLGLNLCRTVVEQHGGALTHHAHTPFGTVFSFTLPAHNAL